MAQTTTILAAGGVGDFARLKLVVLNIANGASETSIAVNMATHGMNSVILYGFMPRDTWTANAAGVFANLSGTTVTYTWSATDVADVLVYAIGY